MNASFSCHEPAARVACINLSAAEIAAVIQFHQRQQKRHIQYHGLISMGLAATGSPQERVQGWEESQNQFNGHEARLRELAAVLNLHRKHGPKTQTVGGGE